MGIPTPLRYAGVALAIVLATVARLALDPVLGDQFPLMLYFVALAFAARYGGLGPSLLALALSSLAIPYFIFQPRGSFLIRDSPDRFGFAVYLLVGLMIALLGESMRANRRQAVEGEHRSRRALEAEHAQREELRTTLASIGDAVIVTDAEGLVVSLNPVAEALTGWGTAKAAGRSLEEVFRTVDEETRRTAEMPIVAVVQEGEIVRQTGHMDLLSRDGTSRAIEHSTAPIRGDRGEITGVVVVFRDISERRRAETALRESEERYRRIVETANEGIWMLDDRQRTTYINERMAQMLGYRAEEMLGRSALDFVFEEDRRGGWHRWDRSERKQSEFRFRRKDGSELWTLCSTTPVLHEDGSNVGGLGMFTDNTERRRAETALRESEERFRQLADTMPQIVWTAGTDGSVDYFNGRWYEYTGITPEESLSNGGWRAAVHPDDIGLFSQVRDRAVDEGEVFEAETRLRDRQGGYRWHLIRGVPVRDESGRVVRRFGTATDIDDRKRAEEALRVGEQRFSRFMQHLPGLAWIKDLDGRYVYANDAAVKGFRTQRADLYGKTDEQVFPPETAAQFRENDRRALASESGLLAVETLEHDDGIRHHSIVSKFPILGSDGEVVLIGGIAIDITDRLQMEEALREADRRKDEFLATLAHELRNPLAPIRNALLLMKHSAGDGHDSEGDAERSMAERQVVHLARLVDDLMDVSRISRGKIELRKEPLELATVVGRAVEAIQTSIEGRGHALSVSLPAEPILLEADLTRLEQVFWNLLSNAAKYTEPGGQIRLSAQLEGDAVLIRVRDTGIGIEPAMLPKIFDMFVQADPRSDRSQGGLGIGLGLVKTLVEMHGGSITAHSKGPGTGSEFVLRLPTLKHAPEGRVDPGRGDRPQTGTPPRRRILVVDDNVDAAKSLAKVLTRLYGQEVQVTHDGPSTLEAARRSHPEVILLDLGMPGMDGYEVARRLRGQPEFDQIMLVALTGWGQESDRQKSSEAGFDRHLVKPVDPEAIRELLAGLGNPARGSGAGRAN